MKCRTWAEVHRLFRREGWGKTKIAEKLGMSRNTVARLLELSEPPHYERKVTGSKLDPHKGSITQMLDADLKVSARVILEHLRREGYGGGITILKHYRVAFATATEWVLRLSEAKRARRLADELERLGRIPLLIVDEVGYIPFDPEAASLFFSLVSSRYERSSLIVSSNKSFSAWAEIFGDAVAVAAMVDRLVHHAEVIVLKGESYRLRGKGKEVMAAEQTR